MTDLPPVKLIPVREIATQLGYEDAVTAIAIALEEVCIAEAMVGIHGPEHGARKYIETGGRMRSLDDGSPALLWFDGITSRL